MNSGRFLDEFWHWNATSLGRRSCANCLSKKYRHLLTAWWMGVAFSAILIGVRVVDLAMMSYKACAIQWNEDPM